MKKTYVNPEVQVIKLNAVSMLASSMGIIDTPVDSSEDNIQLGRDTEVSSSNVWDKNW